MLQPSRAIERKNVPGAVRFAAHLRRMLADRPRAALDLGSGRRRVRGHPRPHHRALDRAGDDRPGAAPPPTRTRRATSSRSRRPGRDSATPSSSRSRAPARVRRVPLPGARRDPGRGRALLLHRGTRSARAVPRRARGAGETAYFDVEPAGAPASRSRSPSSRPRSSRRSPRTAGAPGDRAPVTERPVIAIRCSRAGLASPRWLALGKRVGYLALGVAIVGFVAGVATSFATWTVVVSTTGLDRGVRDPADPDRARVRRACRGTRRPATPDVTGHEAGSANRPR